MTRHQELWFPGIPLALSAAVLFGAATPLSKLLLGAMDPWLLAGILYLGAGFGLLIYRGLAVVQGEDSDEAPLRNEDMPWISAVVLFGGVAGPVFLMFGLMQTKASSASLLLNLEGITTMVIAWVAFKENVDRRLILGAAAIVCGALILSWQGQSLHLDNGSIFIALACLSWGIDNNLARKLSIADPVQLVIIKGIVAGGVNLGIAVWLGAHLPQWQVVVGGGLVGLFGIGVSLVFFMLGLRHLGTARTGAYFSLAPFIGAVLSILLLGDELTWRLGAAGVLMGFGLWLHLSERHEHEHSHEEIEHEHQHYHDDHHQHSHDNPVTEPHLHLHRHVPLRHKHPHYPDIHHRHSHSH